nr:MAG TPA: hypothetical protein [Caudoviricetes sp.]
MCYKNGKAAPGLTRPSFLLLIIFILSFLRFYFFRL